MEPITYDHRMTSLAEYLHNVYGNSHVADAFRVKDDDVLNAILADLTDDIKYLDDEHEDYDYQYDLTVAKYADIIDMARHQRETKELHPDTIILYRRDARYTAIQEDANTLSGVLIDTTMPGKETIRLVHKTKGLLTASFPHQDLDVVLPSLIRHGHRVAICDWVTRHRKTLAHR